MRYIKLTVIFAKANIIQRIELYVSFSESKKWSTVPLGALELSNPKMTLKQGNSISNHPFFLELDTLTSNYFFIFAPFAKSAILNLF